jgi:predicted nucleic acid-binding Zn ribbon protein
MSQETVCPQATLQNMPNKSRPHKRSVPQRASRPPRTRAHSASQPRHSGSLSQPAHSVKDLLARSVPVLSQAADQSARQAFWHPWLAARLPPELAPHITGVTERDGSLVVFAASPAWSARLRYALQELSPRVREAQPDITEVTVRVLPRRSK